MVGQREGDLLDRWLSGEPRAALESLAAEAADVIGIMDRELIVRYVNWTAPGLTREGVIGSTVFNLVPPAYTEIAREAFSTVLRTGVCASFETMFASTSGVLIWAVRVGPIRHAREVIGLITISTDVTEQRRGEADRDRFFALSRDMLVVVTPDGLLKRVNPAFGALLGYDFTALAGKPFIDFVHPDDHAATLAVARAAVAGNGPDSFENRYRRSDGTYRSLSWRGAVDPVTGDGYSVARDITDQRAAEAQLRQAQKMEAVGQFAGGIAHDFNNLMQAVLANVEAALSIASLPDSAVERLREIGETSHRASELTRQLLVFTRRQPPHRLPLDLNALTTDLLKLVRRLIPEHIRIERMLGENLPWLSADKTQLERMIINLCVNARDAMESGGVLTLTTSEVTLYTEPHAEKKPRRFVQLCVRDSGVGMSEDVRQRAFEPFFTTKSQQRGTGLGLATVYAIVQQHGGLIDMKSERGKGTTVRVCLPVDADASTTPVVEPAAPVRTRAQETILLAEDDDLVCRTLLRTLEHAGYRTLAASNGSQAIDVLRAHLPDVDLVVLDLVMPELDGLGAWEIMHSLRPDLSFIFTSGYAEGDYSERLPPYAVEFKKPFRIDDLLRRIRLKLDG